ncbi:MAG: polysaccharide biosynthesis tyrosine autokinase [Candidatus Schekmanbacteria bacterium]|nr:polysaccharide biosynthesis tyrosine autokinase [Candidatus Schekmanbacteria bacterium]
MTDLRADNRLISILDKNSFIAEQYRSIRAKILLSTESSYKKTILVTSSVPKEGKTLTAANLSISIAQGMQEKVLLIDSDLRQPTLHKIFQITPLNGLSDYLTHDLHLEEVILPTHVEKLSIIPAGSLVSNPFELLATEKMSSLIMELRAQVPDRFIIFDSPPLIPVSDTMILAKMVDWTIFVILAGQTPRDLVAKALTSYGRNNILGVILNRLEVPPNEYSYSKYYYRY